MKVDLQQAQERADQPFPLEAELTQKSELLATLSDPFFVNFTIPYISSFPG